MDTPTELPPVRACIFDMDGLLIDTEDRYSNCQNRVLERYNRPCLPWSVKANLQGRPGPAAAAIFHEWAQLPIEPAEFDKQCAELQKTEFPESKPLPGVLELLAKLQNARSWASQGASERIYLALATSSSTTNFNLKTQRLGTLFSAFDTQKRILGDDDRLVNGRGKPYPDIYLLALKCINDTLPVGTDKVQPNECLVFEDSVPGVEAARRAGMRVVWCPHPELKILYRDREDDVLAGNTGQATDLKSQVGSHRDGQAEYLESLENFVYQRYGIVAQVVTQKQGE